MIKIWIVEYGDGDDFQTQIGAFEDRNDAFEMYAKTVQERLSNSGMRAQALDYNPGGELHVARQYGSAWVELSALDVTPKSST